MTIDEIIAAATALENVLALRPQEGDGTPEIAWGDAFFYYAPDGTIPGGQPFATIVTKNYPDDTTSDLDGPGAYRVNVHVGATAAAALLTGRPPTAPDDRDAIMRHPVYGAQGWIAVVEPGPRTRDAVLAMLTTAHRHAADRHHRRHRRETADPDPGPDA